MNDLIELHQNEIENLKQGLVDMEEKVQYQSEERLRDVHEVLENCQTRVSFVFKNIIPIVGALKLFRKACLVQGIKTVKK